MNIRFIKSIIAYLLIVCTIAVVLPSSNVLAQSISSVSHDAKSNIDSKVPVIGEVVSLREETVKHFSLPDGTYQAVAYGSPVHRKDSDGNWKDIDNRLIDYHKGNDSYSTSDGWFTFYNNSSSKVLYTIDDGVYKISCGLVSDKGSFSRAMITNHEDNSKIAITDEEKIAEQKEINNTTTVKYPSTFDGIDLEYIISGNNLKENIVISKPTTTNEFIFNLYLEGLSAKISDNTILLINDTGETVYTMPSPFMYDASGAESDCVSYSLEEAKDRYTIAVKADLKWINDKDRVFPIVIDPTVTQTQNLDTSIYSANPNTNYGNSQALWVGNERITYIQATKPSLPRYAQITSATLTLKYYFHNSGSWCNIGLYMCEHAWRESTLTWNTASGWTNKGLSTTRTSTAYAAYSSGMSSSNPGTLTFTITPIVKQWFSGSTNNGIGLKYESGNDNYVLIHSYQSPYSSKAYYTIDYTIIVPIIENGVYFLQNKATNRFSDIKDQSMNNGVKIHQWDLHGGNTQRWEISYSHIGNYYTIRSMQSEGSSTNYYLGVKDDSIGNNVQIVLRDGVNSNGSVTISRGMLWEISTTSSGAYKIRALTGLSYDRVLASATYVFNQNGISIQQRDYVNDSNYKDEWLLTNVKNIYGSKSFRVLSSNMYTSINCHGYAMYRNDMPTGWLTSTTSYLQSITPTLIIGSNDYSNAIKHTVSMKTKSDFEAWLTNNGYSYQYESTLSNNGGNRILQSNQYRVVLRTGLHNINYTYNGQTYFSPKTYDYHFWYQTSDGTWADKHGFTMYSAPEHLPSGITPESISTSGWNLDYKDENGNNIFTYNNFYDGDIFVYIITN